VVRSKLVSMEFFVDINSFRSHYGPGGKGGRCVRLTTLPPSCAVVMKSGNLNFLEPSGALQACNGTDLPFFYSPLCTDPAVLHMQIRWPKPCDNPDQTESYDNLGHQYGFTSDPAFGQADCKKNEIKFRCV